MSGRGIMPASLSQIGAPFTLNVKRKAKPYVQRVRTRHLYELCGWSSRFRSKAKSRPPKWRNLLSKRIAKKTNTTTLQSPNGGNAHTPAASKSHPLPRTRSKRCSFMASCIYAFRSSIQSEGMESRDRSRRTYVHSSATTYSLGCDQHQYCGDRASIDSSSSK